MILRSIKLVHFAGVTEFALSDLPARGLVDPKLPPTASPRILADALAFAFLGAPTRPETVISDGAGFAYVEVGFRLADDAPVSIFRGVDRHGGVQASLREGGGSRVTGGETQVLSRLEELVGAPLRRWHYATHIESASSEIDDPRGTGGLRRLFETARRAPDGPSPRADATESPRREIEALRERAELAVDALSRVLRALRLKERIDTDYAALSAFGARLRRERADVDLVVRGRSASAEPTRSRPDGGSDDAQRVHSTASIETTSPLRDRLEMLDGAVAAFDAEIDRAARATRRPPSSRDQAAGGLSRDDRGQDPRTRIARLGDAVYHAAVERDALLAVGVGPVEPAVHALRAALLALAEGAGDRRRALAALRHAGLSDGAAVDPARLLRDEDLCERLSGEIDAVAGTSPDAIQPPDAHAASRAGIRGDLPDATSRARESVARLLSDVAETVTGGQFVLYQVGPRLELMLLAPGGSRPAGWDDLTADVRERLELALRLRLADEALDSSSVPSMPRHVVLAERPSTFADDAALVEFVRSVAPGIAQIVVPRAAARQAGDCRL